MDLSLEAYRIIVKNVGNRSDIAVLCRVSKAFQQVAERALYNTLLMHDVRVTLLLCRTLAGQARLAAQVDALTISVAEESTDEDVDTEEDEEVDLEESYETADDDLDVQTMAEHETAGMQRATVIPDDYWESISKALHNTRNLRYLNIHVSSHFSTSCSWILLGCDFRLRSFHCDLDWDRDLVTFMDDQREIEDLYIADFRENALPQDHPIIAAASPISSDNAPTPGTLPPDSPSPPQRTPTPPSAAAKPDSSPLLVGQASLPHLRILECTFTEAANHLLPTRPVAHLKTCFSRSIIEEKRAELSTLVKNAALSSCQGGIISLDLADSDYTDDFSLEILQALSTTLATSLSYLGTLALPIGGRERLQFYALLMRFPRIQCIELEVSRWIPIPDTFPAFKALGGELRLYCPKITRVIFVHEFDRTVVTYLQGICTLDYDVSPELLWRDLG